MPIANVALTNTFDEQRGTINQLVVAINDMNGEGTTYRNITANGVAANSATVAGVNVGSSLAATMVHANAAFLSANAGFDQANTARTHANTAHVTANAAFGQANTANTTSVASFAAANTAQATGVASFAAANTAQTTGVASFAAANTAQATGVASFAAANTAQATGVAAFAAANTSNTSGSVQKTGNTMTGALVMSGANVSFSTVGSGLIFDTDSRLFASAANTISLYAASGEHVLVDRTGMTIGGGAAGAGTLTRTTANLHVRGGSSGATPPGGSAGMLAAFESANGSDAYITTLTSINRSAALFFTVPGKDYYGGIIYDDGTGGNQLRLRANSSFEVKLDGRGCFMIRDGSNSAPTLSFTSGSTVGLFRDTSYSSDTLAVAGNGFTGARFYATTTGGYTRNQLMLFSAYATANAYGPCLNLYLQRERAIGEGPAIAFHVAQNNNDRTLQEDMGVIAVTADTTGTSQRRAQMEFHTRGIASSMNKTLTLYGSNGHMALAQDTAIKSSGTAWANPSDERLKENIQDFTLGLETIEHVRPVTFEFNGLHGTQKGHKATSILAQELKPWMPDSIKGSMSKLKPDDKVETMIYNYDGSDMVWVLVNSVKQLKKRVEELESQLDPKDEV